MVDMESDPGWRYLRLSRDDILKDQSKPFDSKKNCWVPDEEEGYVEAIIKEAKGDTITVTIGPGNEKTLKKELVQDMNPPKFEKAEDMSNLSMLNDASVLHNLRARYKAMLIYTYSGLFCVVINPYKRLPIYTDTVARFFMGKRRTEMPPHLFAVSDEAYRNMLQDHLNQSMLITGESGAGKTENTKKVIAYFASVGASQQEAISKRGGAEESKEKKVTLEDQIVQTNPVLEAFGNAKTVRNNNSSRFGKFIRIHFSKQGRLASCDIEHYLLEKSRVIRQAPGERCYHIFYQIFSDFKPELKKTLLLDLPLKDYWFVAQAELTIDGINDTEEFGLTDEAFTILKFSDTEKMDCYKLMAALMHMGNMKFKQRPREEQAEADGLDEADKASKMYGVEQEDFMKAMLKPRVKVGTEWVNKGQNLEQVNWAVGAMAKGLYSRIFNWLVKKCNQTLDQKGINRDFFIGVLDIAGFEIFDFNSFEQLWINFVNEKLQQFFNHHMFVLEQEEYKREGIDWVFIDFGLDLQACIELIEKPLGIISMLDEECIVPKASDNTLAAKLVEQHLGKHPNFVKPGPPKGKQAEAHFAMRHYAGTVRYNVTNWLEKNKDPLNDTVVQCMKQSKANALLVEVWQDYTTQEEAAALEKKGGGGGGGKKKGKSGSFMTVSMLYRESLNKLMSMLHTTHPHFIRCIIPNEKKTCGLIDAALVLNQLTCNGVLEGIRICRKGFPNRMLHPDYVQRYAILAADEAAANKADPKKAADLMMKRLIKDKVLVEDNFRVGLTKVFFKAGIVAHLEDKRDEKLAKLLTGLQAQVRWYYQQIEKKRNMKKRESFCVIQRNIRQWGFLRQWAWFKLYGKIGPMIKEGKVTEQVDKMNSELVAWKDQLLQEQENKRQLKDGAERMTRELSDLALQLEKQCGSNKEIEERINQLESSKGAIESRLSDAHSRLEYEEEVAQDIIASKKRVEAECGEVKKAAQELDLSLKKAEAEKAAKENQIRSLQDEMKQQDESITKLSKERKQQEEANKKLQDDLQAAEEANLANQKLRQRLQQTIEDVEQSLDREKRSRADADKSRRKAEGELKIAQETVDELAKQKTDIENALRRKENDIHNLGMKLEDEQAAVSKLQRSIKEDEARMNDVMSQLSEEKEARSRSDRARSDIQNEFDQVSEQLDETARALTTQIEFSKKKESELIKLRRDNDEAAIKFNEALGALKKKGQDGAQEMNDQIEQVQKSKNRLEKEKSHLQREFEESSQALDIESKARSEMEKIAKNHEVRLLELRLRADEQSRQLTELISSKGRLHNENSELARQINDLEHQIMALNKNKIVLSNQLEESKRLADEESRERQNLSNLSRNLQRDLDHLKETVEDEVAAKGEANRHLSRAQNELEVWKSKFESEGLIGADEFDEVRRRQNAKVVELQDALDAANAKIVQLENAKARLSAEADANRQEAEHHATAASSLEKKQKAFDKVIDEWKKKVDDLYNELDNAQRESRSGAAEAHKLRGQHDALNDQAEGLKRENKAIMDEIRDLTETLGDNGRQAHALQKHMRRLEVDKDELQRALDEAEAALEAEESKASRAQIEIAQIRSEIEKRISEKEEEFENARKAHQHHMESIQVTLDSETKMKNDLLRIKKKLESDVGELEIGLDHANQANEDAQRNIKRYLDQIRELQAAADEEHRRCEEFRELYAQTERKLAAAKAEMEDLVTKLDALERARRQMEAVAHEAQEHNNELNAQNVALSAAKNQLDSEINLLRSDLSEAQTELVGSEERGRRAIVEAAKLADALRQEQERAQQLERFKKQLESQVKDLQDRADVAEAAVIKGGQKAVLKAEARMKSLQVDYENETRRAQETSKALQRADRKVRELDFQVGEDKKNYDKLQELVEKLHVKLKGQKKALEEAEEQATANLNKYRTIQMALENAEERADAAETSLVRIRSRARATTTEK